MPPAFCKLSRHPGNFELVRENRSNFLLLGQPKAIKKYVNNMRLWFRVVFNTLLPHFLRVHCKIDVKNREDLEAWERVHPGDLKLMPFLSFPSAVWLAPSSSSVVRWWYVHAVATSSTKWRGSQEKNRIVTLKSNFMLAPNMFESGSKEPAPSVVSKQVSRSRLLYCPLMVTDRISNGFINFSQ